MIARQLSKSWVEKALVRCYRRETRPLPKTYRHSERAVHWVDVKRYEKGCCPTKPIERQMLRYDPDIDWFGNKKVNYHHRLPGTSGGDGSYFDRNGIIDPTRRSLARYKAQDYRRNASLGEMH